MLKNELSNAVNTQSDDSDVYFSSYHIYASCFSAMYTWGKFREFVTVTSLSFLVLKTTDSISFE